MADIDRVFVEALAGYSRPDETGKKAIALLDSLRSAQPDVFCAKLTQFCVADNVDDATRILCLVLMRNALIKEPTLTAETLEVLKNNVLALHAKFEPTSQITQKAADALAVIAHVAHSQGGAFPQVLERIQESQTPQIRTRALYLLRRLLESSSVSSTLAPYASNLVGLLQGGMQASEESVKLQALLAMTACLLNTNSPDVLLKSLPALAELALTVALETGSVEAINSLTEAVDALGDLNGKIPAVVSVIAERVLLQAKTVDQLPSVDLAVACLAFLEEIISTDAFKKLHANDKSLCDGLLTVGTRLMALFEQTTEALENWAEDAAEDDQGRIDEGASKLVNKAVLVFSAGVLGPCFANKLKELMSQGSPQASYAGLRIASSIVALFPKKLFKTEIPSMFALCRPHVDASSFLQRDLRVVWAAMAVQKEIFDAYSPSVQRQAKMGADLPALIENLLSIGGLCCQNLDKPGYETTLFQVLITLKAAFPTDDEEDEKRCLSNVKDFSLLQPLMEGTIQRFISPLLQHPKAGLACKARALELLAAFVDLYQSAFSGEKFSSTVGLVKSIFAQAAANPGMEGTLDMAEAAVLLIGNMCIAVSKEEFLPHADDLVGKLQGFLSGSQTSTEGSSNSVAALGGDSMNREILKTLMIVAGRMGSDFAPYVSMVLPSILAKASQSDATIEQKDAANCNGDEYRPGTQLVGTSGRIRFVQRIDAGSLLVIEFNQFVLEETQLAVESIGELAANMGPAFLPHLEGSLRALGAAMHHPMSMVRVAAVLAVGEVLSVVLRVPMSEKVNLEESPDAFTAPPTDVIAKLLQVLLDTTFVPPAQGLSLAGFSKTVEEANSEAKTSYSVMGAILKIVHKNDDSASLSKYAMRALLTPLEAISLAMHEAALRGPEHRAILEAAINSAGQGLFFTETMRVLGGILTEMAKEIIQGAGASTTATAEKEQDDEEEEEDDFEDYEDNATPAEKVVDSAHQVVSAILKISHSCASVEVHDRVRQAWLEHIAPVLTAGLGLSPSVPRLTSDACLVAALLNVADFVRLGANNKLVFATSLESQAASTAQQPDAVVLQLAEKALPEAIQRLRMDPALLSDDAEVGDSLMILQGAAYLVGAIIETVPQVAIARFEEIASGLAHTLSICNEEDYRMLLDTYTTALLKLTAVALKQNQATGKAEEAVGLLLKTNSLPVREEVVEAVVGNDILLELVAVGGLGSQWGQSFNASLRSLLSALNEQPWLVSASARASNLIARAAQKLM